MQIRENLAQVLARLAGLGYRPVFLDNPPMDAKLYGAGWGVYVFEKNGRMWQLAPNPARRIAVIARLGWR